MKIFIAEKPGESPCPTPGLPDFGHKFIKKIIKRCISFRKSVMIYDFFRIEDCKDYHVILTIPSSPMVDHQTIGSHAVHVLLDDGLHLARHLA